MRLIVIIFVLALTLSAAWPAQADGPLVYVVQSGDTLSGIATRYQTSVDAIARLNNLSDRDQLSVGQKLTVMTASGGEIGAADSPTAKVGPRRDAKPQKVHIVAPGETLSQIAAGYELTVDALVRANELSSAALINVGQRLVLPFDVTPEQAGPESLASGRVVTYAIRENDTLQSIALRYGLDARSVAAINHMPSANWLRPGQKMTLPLGWHVKDAPTPALTKRIEVNISQQRVYVWEGSHLVYTFIGSTGITTHPTRRGRFVIQSKIPMAVSTGLNLDMPYWLGIYYAGSTENGFHALPINRTSKVKLWGGLIGRPVSYGCVVLRDADMKTLYDWAEIGVVVDIHD